MAGLSLLRDGICGVRPGMPLTVAREKLLQAGFVEDVPPFRFRRGELLLALLVSDNRIFGMNLEAE